MTSTFNVNDNLKLSNIDFMKRRFLRWKYVDRNVSVHASGYFYFYFYFYIIFFNKKFMPISARGTTVAQANSECTLITTDYNKEVLKCDLNVESVGWFVILLDNEFHEDTVLGT